MPRPGHVDYAGGIKYHTTDDMRSILERASARETTMRVAVGAVARCLLEECGIYIGSHVVEIGGVKANCDVIPHARDLNEQADASEVRVLNRESEAEMIRVIDRSARGARYGRRRF